MARFANRAQYGIHRPINRTNRSVMASDNHIVWRHKLSSTHPVTYCRASSSAVTTQTFMVLECWF